MSVKNRLFRNVGASAFSKFSSSFSSVASVPILIGFLGVETYSTWLVIAAIPVWLAMADVGFGSVAANEMSLRVSRDDWSGAERVFQSAWASVLMLSAVGGALAIVAAWLLPWAQWLRLESMPTWELRWTMGVLGLSTLISLQGALSSGLFRAVGKADLAIGIAALKPWVDLGFSLLAMLFARSVFALAIALFVSQFLFAAASMICGLRLCPAIRLGIGKSSLEDVWYCLRKGVAFCVFPMGNACMLQGTTLVVNHMMGGSAVVIFNTCRTLMRSSQQAMNLLGQSVWPEFSHLVGAGDWARVRKLHQFTLGVNIILAIGISLVVVTIGPWVYQLWTARQLQVDRLLLGCFVLGILANAVWFAGSVVIFSANRHEGYAAAYLIGSVLTIPGCFLLTSIWGLYGAALAPLISDLIVTPYILYKTLQITGESMVELGQGMISTFGEIGRRAWRREFRMLIR